MWQRSPDMRCERGSPNGDAREGWPGTPVPYGNGQPQWVKIEKGLVIRYFEVFEPWDPVFNYHWPPGDVVIFLNYLVGTWYLCSRYVRQELPSCFSKASQVKNFSCRTYCSHLQNTCCVATTRPKVDMPCVTNVISWPLETERVPRYRGKDILNPHLIDICPECCNCWDLIAPDIVITHTVSSENGITPPPPDWHHLVLHVSMSEKTVRHTERVQIWSPPGSSKRQKERCLDQSCIQVSDFKGEIPLNI